MHEALLKIVRDFGGACQKPRVLDFGCGCGTNALGLKKVGFDVYGVDILQDEISSAKGLFESNGFDASCIRHISVNSDIYNVKDNYHIPFEDSYFDFIYSCQVFEHVSHLGVVLCEIKRVLKPNGIVYACFPTKYTVVDGHLKIPFVHWLPYSKLRARYIDVCYKLGFGEGRSIGGQNQNEYLRNGVFYLPYSKINAILNKYFQVKQINRYVWSERFERKGLHSLRDVVKYAVGFNMKHRVATRRGMCLDLFVGMFAFLKSFGSKELILTPL